MFFLGPDRYTDHFIVDFISDSYRFALMYQHAIQLYLHPDDSFSFLQQMSCDLTSEPPERQEFSFTLYDFDGHGRVTKDVSPSTRGSSKFFIRLIIILNLTFFSRISQDWFKLFTKLLVLLCRYRIAGREPFALSSPWRPKRQLPR